MFCKMGSFFCIAYGVNCCNCLLDSGLGLFSCFGNWVRLLKRLYFDSSVFVKPRPERGLVHSYLDGASPINLLVNLDIPIDL